MCLNAGVEFIDKLFVHWHQRNNLLGYEFYCFDFNLKLNHYHDSHDDINILQLHKYDLDNAHDNFVLNVIHGYSDEH